MEATIQQQPDLDGTYDTLSKTPTEFSTLHDHFPDMKRLAGRCDTIVEFGVWRAHGSTWAFLAGRPKRMISLDIRYHINIEQVRQVAEDEGIDFHFVLGDSRAFEMPECDLLFIDSDHTYAQMRAELKHAPKVRRWILMHDTVTCWEKSINSDEEGIGRAIEEFLEERPE